MAEYVGSLIKFSTSWKNSVEDVSLAAQQFRDLSHSNDEMDLHRKAHQFLRSSLKTKVNLNILTQAHSPAEAWLSLESLHNPQTIASAQSLFRYI